MFTTAYAFSPDTADSPFRWECLHANSLTTESAAFYVCILQVSDLRTLCAEKQKLRIQPAERKEFVCATVKGSICRVIVAHGLLPSVIKYLRVVHPKSAALLTHHQSPAVRKGGWNTSPVGDPLFQPRAAALKAEAVDKASPRDSPTA